MRVAILVIITIIILYLLTLAAEDFTVTGSNHGPYEFDTSVYGHYVRAVDPGRARALVNPLLGDRPINPIADVSGFT